MAQYNPCDSCRLLDRRAVRPLGTRTSGYKRHSATLSQGDLEELGLAPPKVFDIDEALDFDVYENPT